jgi:hypothetical protein
MYLPTVASPKQLLPQSHHWVLDRQSWGIWTASCVHNFWLKAFDGEFSRYINRKGWALRTFQCVVDGNGNFCNVEPLYLSTYYYSNTKLTAALICYLTRSVGVGLDRWMTAGFSGNWPWVKAWLQAPTCPGSFPRELSWLGMRVTLAMLIS